MYFDLNIPVPPQLDRAASERLKLILFRHSQFNDQVVVALNYTLTNYSANTKLPVLTSPIQPDNMKLLTRVTVETDSWLEEDAWQTLKSKYDLVSLRTSDRAVFEKACESKHIDIISLDPTQRLAFTIDSTMVNHAIDNDIYFEFCYAPAIRDDLSRAYVYQLGHALLSCTSGKHVILSSGAEIVAEVRAPFDVYYFVKSFGLPNDKAKFTYWKNPESLITKRVLVE